MLSEGTSTIPLVLIDTNVWSYISEAGWGNELSTAAAAAQVQIAVPPSIVEEALRLPDRHARRRLITLLTNRHWSRLLPEAHAEAMDFLSLASDMRPAWLRTKPRREIYDALVHSFEGPDGFWRFARRFTTAAAQASAAHHRESLAQERAWTTEDRTLLNDHRFGSLDVSVRGRLSTGLPGYDGDEIEPWRAQAFMSYSTATAEPGGDPTHYRTWLEPWIDIDVMRADEASLVRLCLYEASAEQLPRAWTRWAVRLAQATRRTTPGTPGDNLLSSWWPHICMFITADQAFAQICDKVRKDAPVPLATAIAVPAGDAAVTATCEAILGIGRNQ